MAVHSKRNFSRGKLSLLDGLIANGDIFEKCNFSQCIPHTDICVGYDNLTFTDCNLMNCDVPAGSVVNGGLTIQKELCANLHPDLVDQEILIAESENCDHVVDVDEIYIDDELIDVIYYYKDVKVS